MPVPIYQTISSHIPEDPSFNSPPSAPQSYVYKAYLFLHIHQHGLAHLWTTVSWSNIFSYLHELPKACPGGLADLGLLLHAFMATIFMWVIHNILEFVLLLLQHICNVQIDIIITRTSKCIWYAMNTDICSTLPKGLYEENTKTDDKKILPVQYI